MAANESVILECLSDGPLLYACCCARLFFYRRQYVNRATVVEWTNSFVSLCMCRMNWHLFFRFQFNSHYSIIFDSLKVFLCYVLPVKSGVPRALSPTSHTTVFFASKKKSLNQDETQMQNQFFQSNSQLDSIEIKIVKRNVWQIRILIFICRSICFQLAQMYPELVSRVILSSLLNKRAISSALTTKALFLSWSGFIFLRVPFDLNGCVCVCACAHLARCWQNDSHITSVELIFPFMQGSYVCITSIPTA